LEIERENADEHNINIFNVNVIFILSQLFSGTVEAAAIEHVLVATTAVTQECQLLRDKMSQ